MRNSTITTLDQVVTTARQRQEALRLAVQEARSKAEAIADALGVRLGPVQQVNESGVSIIRPQAYYARGGAMMAEASTPVEPGQVVFYQSEKDIPGSYEKIALITTKGGSMVTGNAKHINAARKKAAKLGANGVLLIDMDNPSEAGEIAGTLLGTGSYKRGQLIAIRVTTDE